MNNVNVMTDSTDSGFSKPKIFINPPPIDARCECCGVHIDKLTPYGGKGDPLVGDFSGAKLVENYRSIGNHPQCSVGASQECQDCVIKSNEEYWAIMNARGDERRGDSE